MNQNISQDANWYQATTLTERIASLRGGQRRPLRGVDADAAQRRMKRWRSQAPFAASPYFAQRLATDGLSEDDLLYCLGEPADALHCRLPSSQGWLERLLCAFSRPVCSDPLPLPETLRSRQIVGFLNLIEPLLRESLDRVREGAEELARSWRNLPFEPRAVTETLAHSWTYGETPVTATDGVEAC